MQATWVSDPGGNVSIGTPVEPWKPGTRLGWVGRRGRPQYLTLVEVRWDEEGRYWYVHVLHDHDPRYIYSKDKEFGDGYIPLNEVYYLSDQDSRYTHPERPDDMSYVAVLPHD